MQDSQIPNKIPTPFSSADLANATVPIPTTPQPNGFASWEEGWAAVNADNPAAGGIPPIWQDFKGLFYVISGWAQWFQAGGEPTPYDSTFQTTIGGYRNGAVVGSVAKPGTYWKSTADNNTSDPDTGGANWSPWPISGSLTTNGYLEIPFAGIGVAIIQWGITASIASGTLVNLPIAFPNTGLFSISSINGFSPSSTNPYGTGSAITRTQIQLWTAPSNSPASFVWLAIGF